MSQRLVSVCSNHCLPFNAKVAYEYTERDSAKDQAFVLIFIVATVGLLLYAALRPWLQKTVDVSILERASFNRLGVLLMMHCVAYTRTTNICTTCKSELITSAKWTI